MTPDNYYVDYPVFLEEDISQLSPIERMRQRSSDIERNWLSDWPYDYVRRPWLYFILDGDSLKCLGTNCCIPCDRGLISEDLKNAVAKFYPALFFELPFVQTIANPDQTISVLQKIATILKGKKFTSYHKALMNFKWKSDLLSFPLFDLQCNISTKEGKLWIVCYDNNWNPFYKLLTDQEVNEAIKYWRDTSVRMPT